MSDDYVLLRDLVGAVTPPEDGIHSRTLHAEDGLRLVVFGFAEGERLTEHTSTRPAIVEVLSGRLRLTLDGTPHEIGVGDWARMAPGLRHAVDALEPTVMLLTLLGASTEE